MDVEIPAEVVQKIKKHPLYTADKKIVVGRGNSNNPDFLIFGEAPGKNENLVGKPFIGRAGKSLDSWLESSTVNSFYISNAVPLIPLDKNDKIRKPTKGELNDFKFFVEWVIDKVNPKYIITLGDSATESLTGKKIKDIFGKVDLLDGKIPLTGTYHPIRYIYVKNGKEKGLSDFQNAVSLLERN